MLMPTKSAGLLKAASVFSLFHTYFDSLHKATAIRIFSDFIYNETEYFDLFLSAKRYVAWLICFMAAAACRVLLLDTLPSISYYFYEGVPTA
jgi:hypothetical protein